MLATLFHGEAILLDRLLKGLGGLVLVVLVFYVAWRAIGWGKRG